MSKNKESGHPYIPNSVPETRREMLQEIGVDTIDTLLETVPKRLRFRGQLNLPKPVETELELKKHMEAILSKNKTCNEYLNFLGGGCWQHFIPAVVDEIVHRAEFVTAYAGNTYSDLGKWQAFFEFQSMMANSSIWMLSASPRLTGRAQQVSP